MSGKARTLHWTFMFTRLLRHTVTIHSEFVHYVHYHVRCTFSSYDYQDEYCWAGAWLYMATQDKHYLQVAEKHYEGGAAWGESWDEKNSGCMVLTAKDTLWF